MKWVEVIHVRSNERETVRLMETVQRLIDQVNEDKNTEAITLYRRADLGTDLSLQLFHNSAREESNGSQVGLCIAQELKSFGMVNHRVWIEIPNR